jgi:hypothetical protein
VGGFFLWLQLPPPLLARDVVAAAEATHGVTAMVGERCSPTGPAGLLVQDRLRLCFAFLPVEELIEGQSESVFLPFSKPGCRADRGRVIIRISFSGQQMRRLI